MVNISMSKWKLVTNDDSQGFILGFGLFKIFVINMSSGVLSQFAGNSKMCGGVNVLEGRDAIQRSLDRLERYACVNLMKLNKANARSSS